MSLLGLAPVQGNSQTAGPSRAPAASASMSVVQVAASGRLVRVPRNRCGPTTLQKTTPAMRAADIAKMVDQSAQRYQVDPLLVSTLIRVESASNPSARSAKGAEGIMQLLPATARRFGVLDSFDPKQNIDGGVRYLKYLQGLFPTDLTLSIAAFNAGEGAVAKYNTVPPFRETLGYVKKVSEQYGRLTTARQPPATSQQGERHVVTVVDSEGRLYLRTR